MLLLIALLPSASAHGEGGSTLREGSFDIKPASAGGPGYAEAQFALLKGDGLLHQWKVNSPSGARVDFNLHGHVGAQVQIFNRTAGGNGGGSMVAPAEMKVALMWRSNATVPVNVSYAVQLQHAPDLYSSAFFTANLAGLVLLFAAVWELSIRGRKKVEGVTPKVAEHDESERQKGDQKGNPEQKSEKIKVDRPGFFSNWTRRAALYAIVLLLCFTPLFSYFVRPGEIQGTEPQPEAWAAFVGYETGNALTVVDPVRGIALGGTELQGRPLQLLANPAKRLVYALTLQKDGFGTLEYIDGSTFAILRSANLTSQLYGGAMVAPDGARVYATGKTGIDVFDAESATAIGRINVTTSYMVGFLTSPSRLVLFDFGNGDLLTYRESDFQLMASLRLGNDTMGVMLAPSGTFLVAFKRGTSPGNFTLDLLETDGGRLIWSVAADHFVSSWLPDESAILGGVANLVAHSAVDGSVIASVPIPGGVGGVRVAESANLVYVSSRNGTNLTVVNPRKWQIVASFEAGDPGGISRPLLLDSTGGYAILLSAGSGELVTFHDQPDHHYHSRMKV
ncbi:MAG TPA: hypothetical protein VI893_05765, partial [Thermoplasmata archaeon]|nr:hypothetical protein [Thermoplasmata archaeon]